uniref:Uncharacterized protein n=1 Tax=Arundo donax TaxID=35708 RepID=A0A0A9FGV7_ARUDO
MRAMQVYVFIYMKPVTLFFFFIDLC